MIQIYPGWHQRKEWMRRYRLREMFRVVPYGCIARRADGSLCGRPAGVLDRERGGLICWTCYQAEQGKGAEEEARYLVPTPFIEEEDPEYGWRAEY